jgi:hypothetical protein
MFAPKGEKQLYKAIQAQDDRLRESVNGHP